MKPSTLLPGLASSALALGFLWAASRLEPSLPFPPFSLAERAIRLAPGDLATFMIERLEHRAVPLLAGGMTLAFLLVGTFLPRALAWRGHPRPWLAGAVLAAGAAAASASDPVRLSPAAVAIPALAGGALYATALGWLVGLSGLYADERADLERRRTLAWLGAIGLGVAAGGSLLGRLVEGSVGPDRNVAIRRPDRAARGPQRPPFPDIPGLSSELTSAADHYVVDIDLTDPVVEADGWTLEVTGEVDQPLELTFDELQRRFPLVEEHSVLTCISNEVGGPLVGSSRWTGVRLRDVLSSAGLGPGAVDVVFHCADGYSASIPVRRALEPSVLVAVAQNGEPLTQEHGFPCRVRAPALYGIKNAKWLERIEVVRLDQESYWTERGWTDVGTVRTASRIDTPRRARRGEAAWVAGVAWAGERGISRVELSLDGGRTWREATLRRPLSRLAWTQWAQRWTPLRGGLHKLVVRATDANGRRQEERRRRPHPSGASGYHEVDVEVL